MPDVPSVSTAMQRDREFDAWVQFHAPGDTRLLQLWDGLTDAQKLSLLDSISPRLGKPSAATAATVLSQLQSMQPAAKPAAATPSATSAAGKLSSADSAAAAPGPQLAQSVQGIAVPGPSGSTPGFTQMLQSYTSQQFKDAGTDVTALARLAGMDPGTLQSQYQSYTSAFQSAQTKALQPGYGSQGAAPHTLTPPMTIAQFAQGKGQANTGPWAAVLNAINGIYLSQMGVPLPSALAMQIVSQLNAMPKSQASNVLYNAYEYMNGQATALTNGSLFDQTGSLASAVLQSLPTSILTYTAGTGTQTGSIAAGSRIVGTYMTVNPSALIQGETIEQTIAADFQKALNRAPTAADMAALGSDPSPTAIQNYINEQPVQGMGMTYGQLQAVTQNMTSLWQQYFSTSPSNAELQWGVGKTPAQLQDFVDNSPSAVPGVTIGRYNDYTSFINSIDTSNATTHAFSGQVDASLISELHNNLQSQSTGTAQPGPMK